MLVSIKITRLNKQTWFLLLLKKVLFFIMLLTSNSWNSYRKSEEPTTKFVKLLRNYLRVNETVIYNQICKPHRVTSYVLLSKNRCYFTIPSFEIEIIFDKLQNLNGYNIWFQPEIWFWDSHLGPWHPQRRDGPAGISPPSRTLAPPVQT